MYFRPTGQSVIPTQLTDLPHRLNPYITAQMPSPISALGCGFRNSTKPEILLPGGRQCFRAKLGNVHKDATLIISPDNVPPGFLVSAPSPVSGQVNMEMHSRGTSNAAALATRSAAFLFEQISELSAEEKDSRLKEEFAPVLIKAMLVHKASWGETYEHLKGILKPAGMKEEKFKRIAGRYLGYGFIEQHEKLLGNDHCATLLGFGELGDDEAHIFQIPLPPSLSGKRGYRRIAVTLATMSPVDPIHRNYRKAATWFEIDANKLKIGRDETEWHAAKNGTLQHEIFSGIKAAAFAATETIGLKVNCRADTNALNSKIRYGIIISVEVAAEIGVNVYDEIFERIKPVTTVRARV